MDMLFRLLRVMLIVAMTTVPARAQTRDNALRAVEQFGLVIEEFDDDNTLCGLTKDGVSTALTVPASSAKFGVFAITSLAQSRGALLYLRIDTVMARPIDACVSTIQLSARALQDLTLTLSQRSVFAVVLLWSRTSVAAAPRSDHSDLVEKEVEKLTKSFIIDWNLDNRAN